MRRKRMHVQQAMADRDIFVKERATEGAVERMRLDDRRVVVFATHGQVPGDVRGIDQAALALSNPALSGDVNEDRFLTMQEVLGLKLDADWVVLSACNTASSDGYSRDALSGLGRAFFFAGTRSILVSSWAVETTSARSLTVDLFTNESRFPGNRAEPLRQAMLSLMKKQGTLSNGELYSYAHPVFWAPFSLVGDPGRP